MIPRDNVVSSHSLDQVLAATRRSPEVHVNASLVGFIEQVREIAVFRHQYQYRISGVVALGRAPPTDELGRLQKRRMSCSIRASELYPI